MGQLIAFRIIAGYVTGNTRGCRACGKDFNKQGYLWSDCQILLIKYLKQRRRVSQIALPTVKGNIVFDRVTFRFERGPKQIKDVSLEIESGSFIGIVGQSGSGKSTLMKLVPRLYEPVSGRILIDDYDISKVSLSSVRQQIGEVPQDCLLFEGTIRDNISMNNPEADTESIIQKSCSCP